MASMEITAVLANQHAISEKGYRVTEPLDQMRGKTDAKTLTQVLDPAYTLETVDAGGVSAVWVTPPDVTTDFVYLFYHGGAYVKGNVAASHKAVFALCKTLGARCLTVDSETQSFYQTDLINNERLRPSPNAYGQWSVSRRERQTPSVSGSTGSASDGA